MTNGESFNKSHSFQRFSQFIQTFQFVGGKWKVKHLRALPKTVRPSQANAYGCLSQKEIKMINRLLVLLGFLVFSLSYGQSVNSINLPVSWSNFNFYYKGIPNKISGVDATMKEVSSVMRESWAMTFRAPGQSRSSGYCNPRTVELVMYNYHNYESVGLVQNLLSLLKSSGSLNYLTSPIENRLGGLYSLKYNGSTYMFMIRPNISGPGEGQMQFWSCKVIGM